LPHERRPQVQLDEVPQRQADEVIERTGFRAEGRFA
jgi:hypothetical protein